MIDIYRYVELVNGAENTNPHNWEGHHIVGSNSVSGSLSFESTRACLEWSKNMWRFSTMKDPQVTMGFNTKMV
jgi:hypothetical protein